MGALKCPLSTTIVVQTGGVGGGVRESCDKGEKGAGVRSGWGVEGQKQRSEQMHCILMRFLSQASGTTGGSWLRNHLWCPNDPRG